MLKCLVRTLVGGGVNVCFSNPGTSEMHFVAALDRVDGMRCVLALFEGVATGAADGYARMKETPAATLLHLGPGLANGLANLHNAMKASTPVVNIVGDHATYHRDYNSPLTSDIETAAKPFSGWVKTSPTAKTVAEDGAAAIAAAMKPPGQVATLILPGDTAWDEGSGPAKVPAIPERAKVSEDAVKEAARVLRSGEPAVLLLTGLALREKGLELAARIAGKTGCRLLAQTFNRRMERGAGRISIDRIPYPVEQALKTLEGVKHIVLVGSRIPVAFFAYPDKPSLLAPKDTQFTTLSTIEEDSVHALEWLADELGAAQQPIEPSKYGPQPPATGKIDSITLAQSIGALIPENAIVVDEGVSTGRGFFPSTRNSHPHTWLQNMGGSIGIGMPLAVRRGGRVPGPQGAEPPGRRLGDVHDPGAVDAGAREPEHHHRAASTTSPTRSCAWSLPTSARRMSAARRSTCSTSRAPISTSSHLRAAWACRASAWKTWTSSTRRSRAALP